jgi:hypothetical protein
LRETVVTDQFAVPVTADNLRSGEVYFSVSYVDEDLLIPVVETFVFLGRDFYKEDVDSLFFQRAESYFAGGPRGHDADGLLAAAPEELNNMFELSGAVDALARCAERWKRRSER